MSNDNFKNFCVIPFIGMYLKEGLYSNKLKVCCEYKESITDNVTTVEEYWNCKTYQDIRKSFNNRVMPSACKICVEDENNNVMSKRQYHNKEYINETSYYYNNQTTIAPPAIYYDFRPSNYCNLECVMCSPDNSTAIDKRVSDYNLKFKLKNDKKIDDSVGNVNHSSQYIDFIKKNSDNIREFLFAGGEPFLMPEVLDLINFLSSTGKSKNIVIRILTNGTIIRKKWLEQLSTFKDVRISVSLDGVDDVVEYARYPNKWSVLDKNMQLFKQYNDNYSNIRVSLNPVIHILNFVGFHKLIRYANEHNFRISTGFVYTSQHWQDYLNYKRLHQHIRQEEVAKIRKELENINDNLHDISESSLDKLANDPYDIGKNNSKFKQMVNYWDNHRDIKFLDQYPYLEYLVNNNG